MKNELCCGYWAVQVCTWHWCNWADVETHLVVAVPTSEFLRGSVVSLRARSDLAQLTPLPSDNGWDVRKFGLVLPLFSVPLLSRSFLLVWVLHSSRSNRSLKTSHLKVKQAHRTGWRRY